MSGFGDGATTFARMLYLYRTVNRLSLRDVAKAIGIAAPTLMRIEHGHAMDADTWLKVQVWLFQTNDAMPRKKR